jgi:hypothetical protein
VQLLAEMFGGSDFWLETRVIIDTQETLTNFHGDEAKKKSKMADPKKLSFSKSPILKIFLRKFHGLVLGSVGLFFACF